MDERLYRAELAEQTGRYHEMADLIEKMILDGTSPLTKEGIRHLKEAYMNLISSRRASLRILSSISMEHGSDGTSGSVDYSSKVKNQLSYLHQKLEFISKMDEFRQFLRSNSDVAPSVVDQNMNRDECFQFAKLSEDAQIYSDMIDFIRKGINYSSSEPFKEDELQQIAAAYYRVFRSCRTSCQILSSIQKMNRDDDLTTIIRHYKLKVKKEALDVIDEVLNLMDKAHFIASKDFAMDTKVTYNRYLGEITKITEEESSDDSSGSPGTPDKVSHLTSHYSPIS